MLNSCVVLGCTNRAGSGISFHNIPCDKEKQKVWLITLRPSKLPILKHDHSLEEDYQFNYKLESE